MRHLLAAATFAAMLAAAPAGAQTVYGYDFGGATNDGSGIAAGGNWKENFQIYGSIGPATTAQSAPTGAPQGSPLPEAIQILVNADPNMTLTVNNFGASLTDVQNGGPAIDAVAPIPEPATWAMMLVGFAAVGGALRSRRKATLRYA